MKKTFETIVFFGSGPVAAESLRLLAENFTIEAIITKPRPAHHHGTVPVLAVAQQFGLQTLTATDKQSLDGLFDSTRLQSKIAVLVDFGIIVSQKVIDYFPLGIVNSHFSLLPEWRGADPITFAILSGQRETGVSLMLLVAKMDEGPLLAQAPYTLEKGITAPQLTEELIELSDSLLTNVLPDYIAGEIIPFEQSTDTPPTYSRKLNKKDSELDWHKPAHQLEREIRAFAEWPKSRTKLAGKDVVITHAHVVPFGGNPGEIIASKKQLIIGTAQDGLAIDRLKPAGKQEMPIEAFLAGYGALLFTKS